MVKNRAFSLYDIEQFLKDAGAEKINEKAVISLERELQDTVNELIDDARVYANYAGRRKLINHSDITLANKGSRTKQHIRYKGSAIRKNTKKVSKERYSPKLMLINNIPVIK